MGWKIWIRFLYEIDLFHEISMMSRVYAYMNKFPLNSTRNHPKFNFISTPSISPIPTSKKKKKKVGIEFHLVSQSQLQNISIDIFCK